jgi:hypothetical protein
MIDASKNRKKRTVAATRFRPQARDVNTGAPPVIWVCPPPQTLALEPDEITVIINLMLSSDNFPLYFNGRRHFTRYKGKCHSVLDHSVLGHPKYCT